MARPNTLNAGDTASWSEEGAAADGQTAIVYSYIDATGVNTFTATGSITGDDVDFSLTPTGIPAGIYDSWRVETAANGDKSTTAAGQFTLLPAPDGSGEKTHAQKAVATLEAYIEAMISGGALENFTIDGQSISKMTLEDARKLLNYYQEKLRAENDAITGNPGASSRILYRF